jgi:hypothetical protein
MKLHRTALAALLCICLTGAVSCGVGECEPPPFTALPSLTSYSDSLVTITHPADWEVDEEFFGDIGYGVNLVFMVSDSTGMTGCNLVIEDLPMPMDTAAYCSLGELSLKSLDSYHLICKQETRVDGMEAVKLIYTYKLFGAEFKIMQVAVVVGMEGWTFTFSTTPSQWDQWAYVFDFMANSIQIK